MRDMRTLNTKDILQGKNEKKSPTIFSPAGGVLAKFEAI
jgi:hypothetical protein